MFCITLLSELDTGRPALVRAEQQQSAARRIATKPYNTGVARHA
jgi:hypothetical protein